MESMERRPALEHFGRAQLFYRRRDLGQSRHENEDGTILIILNRFEAMRRPGVTTPHENRLDDAYNQCVIHTNEAIQLLEKIKNKLVDKVEV